MTGSDDEFDAYAARADALVGTTIRDTYRLDHVLGIGGMATVYAATQRNGQRVALKVLHPELALRPEVRQRFVREARAANAVAHPAVVGAIDGDVTDDGTPFLVMELLTGQTVEALWEESGRRLPVRTVLTIGRELCDVLAVAHESGVIHRDIKPGNLFITDDGVLKVLDFGIASLRDLAGTRLTSTGAIVGTPAFLPPEQAAGRVSQIDARSDLWAVGATMFTLLSGRTVHEGESAQHTALLAATVPARSLATVLPTAPPDVVAVVDRALKLDKRERWQTAAELRDAIARMGEPVLPPPATMRTLGGVVTTGAPPLALAPAVGPRAAATVITRPPVRRGMTVAILAGSAAALALAFFISREGRMPLEPTIIRAGSEAPPLSSVSPPSARSSAPTSAVHPTSPSPVTAEPVAPAHPSGPATTGTAERQPLAPQPKTTTSAKPSSATTGAARKDCQPYVIDANGKKVWRPECL